jgi:hypothetical protein
MKYCDLRVVLKKREIERERLDGGKLWHVMIGWRIERAGGGGRGGVDYLICCFVFSTCHNKYLLCTTTAHTQLKCFTKILLLYSTKNLLFFSIIDGVFSNLQRGSTF